VDIAITFVIYATVKNPDDDDDDDVLPSYILADSGLTNLTFLRTVFLVVFQNMVIVRFIIIIIIIPSRHVSSHR